MRLSRMMLNSCRLFLMLPIVILLVRTGVQGQATVTTLRIGLQTTQSEVRLQGTVPVRLLAGETSTDVPADQVLVFTKTDKGLSITDAQG
ncbi:MAG TPA: hypothetical protein VGM23_03610, partial [Armatimonadota bacterium]